MVDPNDPKTWESMVVTPGDNSVVVKVTNNGPTAQFTSVGYRFWIVGDNGKLIEINCPLSREQDE